VQSCIFCGAATSVALPGCHRCGEAFEGAHERKAQREEQQRQQQMMGLATTGISMLGQVATSPSGQGLLGQVFNEIISSATKKS
jgi:hypothetical protein